MRSPMLEHEQLSLDGFPGGTSPAPKRALVLQAVGPVADQLAFGADDKALVVADDGLFARLVHRHSARKAYSVRRYAEIVATAMAPHWPQIWWVELFAGPGRLKEVESDRFLPGSPIEALSIPSRFTGYVFADREGDAGPAQCRTSSRMRPGAWRGRLVRATDKPLQTLEEAQRARRLGLGRLLGNQLGLG